MCGSFCSPDSPSWPYIRRPRSRLRLSRPSKAPPTTRHPHQPCRWAHEDSSSCLEVTRGGGSHPPARGGGAELRPTPSTLPCLQAAATEPPHPAAEPASRALATWALQYAGSAANRLPLRAAATAVLCNLASAGRGLLEHLAAQGAIPVLAQLVASGLPALQAPALVTLRRLSLLPAATAAVAAVAGVPLCLQLLRDSNAAAVHAAAAAQLTAWAAHSAEDRLAAEAAGAVPLLLICLLGNSQRADQRYWLPSCVPEPAQFAVARAIQCLAPEGASLQHRGLLRLVSRMNPGGPTPWVEMDGLAMVAYDSNCGAGVNGEFARHVKLRLLLNAGAIPETVHVLRNSPEPNARALAAAVLRVCAARCQQPTLVASLPAIEAQTATEIVTAGSIPALLSAARSDSHERAQQKLQQAAMCALAQLSSHPSAHTALLEAGVVPVIVQLLFSSDPESAAALAAVDAAWCLAAGSPAVRQALLDSALVRALPAAMQQYHLDRTFVDLAQQVLCMLGATMGSTTTLVSPAGVSGGCGLTYAMLARLHTQLLGFAPHKLVVLAGSSWDGKCFCCLLCRLRRSNTYAALLWPIQRPRQARIYRRPLRQPRQLRWVPC